jgi:hypothetical protein
MSFIVLKCKPKVLSATFRVMKYSMENNPIFIEKTCKFGKIDLKCFIFQKFGFIAIAESLSNGRNSLIPLNISNCLIFLSVFLAGWTEILKNY